MSTASHWCGSYKSVRKPAAGNLGNTLARSHDAAYLPLELLPQLSFAMELPIGSIDAATPSVSFILVRLIVASQ